MVNGCTQCKLVEMGFPEIEIQEASLFNHIRDVINRFVRTGNVSKDKLTEKPPVSNYIVDHLGERLEQTPHISRLKLSPRIGALVNT